MSDPFGRHGEGPGEFRYPTRMSLTDRTIQVFDAPLKRVTLFDHEGEVLETRTLNENGGAFDIVLPLRYGKSLGATTGIQLRHDIIRLVGQSRALIRREGPGARHSTDRIVAIVDSASETVDTILRYDHGLILRVSPRGVGPLRRYWGPGAAWTVSGDSLIALVDGFHGAVRILSIEPEDTRVVRSGSVPIEPQPLDEDDWRKVEAVVRPSGQGHQPITCWGQDSVLSWESRSLPRMARSGYAGWQSTPHVPKL